MERKKKNLTGQLSCLFKSMKYSTGKMSSTSAEGCSDRAMVVADRSGSSLTSRMQLEIPGEILDTGQGC